MTYLWMSLDRCVSCMAAWRTAFTLWIGHLALGCHFHVQIFIFFCDIFGVEMWDKVRNFDSELWNHFAYSIWKLLSQQMGLLTGSKTLFSLSDPLCRSKVCNAMASGRNMCRPAPPVCWEKEKAGVFARWRWSIFRSETSWSIWKHTVRQQENRRAWTRSARFAPLMLFGDLEL